MVGVYCNDGDLVEAEMFKVEIHCPCVKLRDFK